MQKVLTVAVPAYNAAATLEKCLSSFLEPKCLPKLEVLVIDDGSTDKTGVIAQDYAARYPGTFRLIRKENGGHGSGVNRAAAEAAGRYFRVVDADDWVLTENLPEHLRELEQTRADAVITGFHRVQEGNGRRIPVAVPRNLWGRELSLKELMDSFLSVRNCFTIHGICYRMDVYRGTVLTEGIFYEDNEYAILPFRRVKRVQFGKGFLYQYLVGRPGQSIADENQVKRLPHLDKVLWRIGEELEKGFPPAARTYALQKLLQIVTTYETVCLLRNPNRKEGEFLAGKLDERLQERLPEVWRELEENRARLWALHRLHMKGRTLDWILDSSFYRAARSLARKNK